MNAPVLDIPQKSFTSRRLPQLGFLGLGWIGLNRMKAAQRSALAEISAIADPNEDALETAAKLAPHAALGQSLADLLTADVDAIVIATPTALHAEQTIAALRCGKPAFCQKPLGCHSEEVQQILRTAKSSNCLLGIDLSYRYLKGMQEIRRLLKSGSLGQIFAVDATFHNAYGPDKAWFYNKKLAGGGCLLDLGIHLIDAVFWLLETKATGVSARIHQQDLGRGCMTEVENYVSAHVDLANGGIMNLACSWCLHAGQDAIIELSFYGSKGGASLRNINGSFLEFRAESFHGTKRNLLAEPPDEWQQGAILNWINELTYSSHYNPNIETQLEVAKVLDAIYASDRSAKKAS